MTPSCLKLLLLLIVAEVLPLLFHGQCSTAPLTASLKGNNCANSILTVESSSVPASITWLLNGSPLVTEMAAYGASAITVAGDPLGRQGSGPGYLNSPDRIWVDAQHNVYIPDIQNFRVQKWANGATVGVTVAGGNGQGSGMNQLAFPTGVAVDAQGNVYITDRDNNRVQKWAPGATTGTTFTTDVDQPTDVFIDKKGNIYVSEQNRKIVKKWTPGSSIGTVVVDGRNSILSATGIWVDDQESVYVADPDNNTVSKWTVGATVPIWVATGGTPGSPTPELRNPLDVAVDCSGNVFVVDYAQQRIQKWAPGATSGTTVLGTLNRAGAGANQLNFPIGIFIDDESNLYVSEFSNHRVQKLTYKIENTHKALTHGVYSAVVSTECCTIATNPITVLTTKTPTVTVSADATSICQGMPVKFSAAYTDGGLQPHFQWLKNNQKVGSDMPTYTASDIAHNDVIECILFSNEACAIDQTPKSNIIQMAVARSGDIEIGDKITICAGMEASFTFTAGYASYLWNDGSAGTSFKTRSEGLVWLKATDACGRSFGDSAVVVVIPPSTHFLPDDLEMCSYNKIQVRSSASFQSYLWNGATGARVFTVEVPGTYRLAGTDTHGCVSFDTVVVSLKQNCLARGIYVPNAFTPQRNGKNDVFKPKVIGTMKAYQFAVFNRYGQIVFQTKDVARGWNGELNSTDQNSNVYIWYCKYQIDDAPARIEKGTVLLMR